MLYLFRPKLAAQFPSISRAAGTCGSSSEAMPEDTAAEMSGQESWNLPCGRKRQTKNTSIRIMKLTFSSQSLMST